MATYIHHKLKTNAVCINEYKIIKELLYVTACTSCLCRLSALNAFIQIFPKLCIFISNDVMAYCRPKKPQTYSS